jgi:hypothetical protein
MMSKVSKFVAILLIAVVVAAGAGYWLFSPKPTSEIANYMSEETSLEVSRRTPEQTLTSSTSSPTTTAAETTLWINVTAAKPAGYYISLLKSAGVQPYVELGWELQALPDATNGTAVAKITYLALNATNPEVKEAFQLMIKGGTPSPSDFRYTVPNYNTELQVLYWLALQNEFKKDDTLALAIAMVNGLWVTMGDSHVREAVKKDTSDLLTFFRETNELQKQNGYYPLEDYPLEAKICLAWAGNMTPIHGPHALVGYESHYDYLRTRLDLKGYSWDTVSASTLRLMREEAVKKHWIDNDPTRAISNLEYYFYFNLGPTRSSNWLYTDTPELNGTIEIAGEEVRNWSIMNVNFIFGYYLRTGSGIGACTDETAFIDALAKSWGIATTSLWRGGYSDGKMITQHYYNIYYEPNTHTWTAYEGQLKGEVEIQSAVYMFIFRPPVQQPRYLEIWPIAGLFDGGNMFYIKSDTTIARIHDEFSSGKPTTEMKQWLLYS